MIGLRKLLGLLTKCFPTIAMEITLWLIGIGLLIKKYLDIVTVVAFPMERQLQ